MLILLDQRDSFTFNVAHALALAGQPPRVLEAARTTRAELLALAPTQLVIGPGPGHPQSCALALELLRAPLPNARVLGICLGMQAIALAFGGEVARARSLVHGWTSAVAHDGRGVFRGLPNPLRCARYHSLAARAERLPECLEISARAPDGELMGLRHRELPIEGVQFHPDSVLSEAGVALLANFLKG